MYQLETQIIINAAAENVWQLLMDIPSHSSWNPFTDLGISGCEPRVLPKWLRVESWECGVRTEVRGGAVFGSARQRVPATNADLTGEWCVVKLRA